MQGESPKADAAAEWREHWLLVVAAAAGFSLYGVSSYSIGLFMEPLAKEFGWTRAQISASTLIPATMMVFLAPLAGAIIDRWGSRRLALPSIALTGVGLAGISLASGYLVQWYLLWVFYGLVTLGIKATVWTTAVSNAFVSARGLALGAALCGGAAVQIVAPPLSQWLVDSFGWRQAYVALGFGWSTPCLILAALFLFEPRDKARQGPTERSPLAVPGLELREALRSVPLLRIGASTLITMFVGTAILVHHVPILTASGMTRGEAVWLASLAGAAGIAGKIVSGWLADRWDAGTVGAITLTAPAAAYLALLERADSPAVSSSR